MEERLRFVARLLDGEVMTDVCREFGVSCKTGYKNFRSLQGARPVQPLKALGVVAPTDATPHSRTTQRATIPRILISLIPDRPPSKRNPRANAGARLTSYWKAAGERAKDAGQGLVIQQFRG